MKREATDPPDERPPPSFDIKPFASPPDPKRTKSDEPLDGGQRFLMTASLEQKVANMTSDMNIPLNISSGFEFGSSLGGGGVMNIYERSASLQQQVMLFDAAEDQKAATDEVGGLKTCAREYEAVYDAFTTVLWDLKHFIAPLAEEAFASLNARVAAVQRQLSAARESLEELVSREQLSPEYLLDWRSLEQEYNLLNEHLMVLRAELQAVYDGVYPEHGIGALVIHSQPFPNVVKQKEKKRAKTSGQEEVPLRLKLLTGARHGLNVQSDVEIEVIAESAKRTKNRSVTDHLDGVTAQVNANGVVMFDTLRFSKGTGVNIVQLRFHCTASPGDGAEFSSMQGADTSFVLETGRSEGLIVITNESQFSNSAGKLLLAHSMGTRSHITWNRFANYLQLHFLTATRQTLSAPERPLSKVDLAYLRDKYHLADGVTSKNFVEFWKWTGAVLHKLRHHKYVPEMYQKGLIFGFLLKEDATALLQAHPVGTFLVRFSQRQPGNFAVAYRVADEQKPVKQTLVPSNNKALADWLNSQPLLTTVLTCKVQHDISSSRDLADVLVRKGKALEGMVKAIKGDTLSGYDDIN